MTLELFEKIKEIVDEIFQKIKKDFKLTINDDEKIIVYYNIYLTSYGIRTGTFIDNFSKFYNYKIIFDKVKNLEGYDKYFSDLFKKIKTIDNLDFSIGAYYDASNFKDIIYVYNKKFYKKIKKSMNYLNKRLESNKKINITDNKLQWHIADLLGYDKVKHKYNYDENKSLGVSFILKNNKKEIEILAYQSYKKYLIKNYERLHKMNNLPIMERYKGNRFYLIIDDIGI